MEPRRLIALLDEHEATVKRIWATHDGFELAFDRQVAKQWRLFMRIIRTKAETLQGIAAQGEILERHWYPIHRYSRKVDAAIAKIMSNMRRLVAAQTVAV